MSAEKIKPFQPIDDLTAQAYRSLRRMILDGEMPPKTRLSHRVLATQLGIGRSPVRDALLQLEAEGLIEHRRCSGIYLREITPHELQCIYELRIVNEPYAAEKAAHFSNAKHLVSLRVICDALTEISKTPRLEEWFESLENRRRFCRLDMDFHATVMEASGNTIAIKMFGNAQILALTFAWDLGYGNPVWFADVATCTAPKHQAIFDAIRNRDSDGARQAMQDHVVWAMREVPEHYAALREAQTSKE